MGSTKRAVSAAIFILFLSTSLRATTVSDDSFAIPGGDSYVAVKSQLSEVFWIGGESAPTQWSISPETPTAGDVIHFSGPTGVYSNACFASGALGGSPTLTIDRGNKTIELWFHPPAPGACLTYYDPVCGLEGSFGPLEPGEWMFFGHGQIPGGKNNGVAFLVPLTVDVAPAGVRKCSVKAGKSRKGEPARGLPDFVGRDSISFSGLLDAGIRDLVNADVIAVTIDSDYMPQPLPCVFAINDGSLKNGKYRSSRIKAGKNYPKLSFKFDAGKHKFAFAARKVDLSGLNCPISVTVEIGNYVAYVELDEDIVNGKKPIPIQFMVGVKDRLGVDKIKVKAGKKAGADSLAVKGGFSLKDEPSEITSMTLFLGDQPFDLTDDAGTFTYKRNSKTSEITSVAYKTKRGETPQIKARLDFVKCSYSVLIKKTELETTFGQTTFGVLIDMSLSDSDYNESAEVDLD